MELIISLCAIVGAFFGSVFAHFVAHDAYLECPRYARTLIERAAGKLPPLDQKRYREEWLADLQERQGVFSKLRHALECLLCARKFASVCADHAPHFVLEIGGRDRTKIDFATGLYIWAFATVFFTDRSLARDDAKKLIQQAIADQYGFYGEIDPEEFKKFNAAIDRVANGVNNEDMLAVQWHLRGSSLSFEEVVADLLKGMRQQVD